MADKQITGVEQAKQQNAEVEVSVVIPVFNEEENIPRLLEKLDSVLAGLNKSCEIVIIDDGSRDGTFAVLKGLREKFGKLRIVRLRTNFGQTAALAAGFDQAKGEIIITMDGDLQNDPEDIPKLLDKVEEGYDVVSGWRRRRKDPFISRRLPSILANKLISWITGVHLHDYGCTLKAYRREIIKHIELYGQMHRFIPALASWVGASITEVEVNHFPRRFGKSKYGISRTIAVILDLITVKFLLRYSTSPIQIFGFVGFISGAAGFILAFYLSIQRLFFAIPLAGRPILWLAILLILIGVQFISMGLLGELQARTYHESQAKPIYIIKEILE